VNDSNKTILGFVTPFVDGELSEQAASEFEKRLADEPRYQRLVAAEFAVKNVVAARAPRYAAPLELKSRIRATLFGDPDAEQTSVNVRSRTFWSLLGRSPALATALGTLAFAITLTVVLSALAGHRVAPFIADAYVHHTAVERFPVTFRGDYESVADQTAQAVGFQVIVPQLGENVSLLGARKCRLCDHLMAFIKYTDDQRPLSLFVVPNVRLALRHLKRQTHDAMVFHTASYEGMRVAFWRDGDFTYCLAGSVEEDRLLDLACKACRQVQSTPTAVRTTFRQTGRPTLASTTD